MVAFKLAALLEYYRWPNFIRFTFLVFCNEKRFCEDRGVPNSDVSLLLLSLLEILEIFNIINYNIKSTRSRYS